MKINVVTLVFTGACLFTLVSCKHAAPRNYKLAEGKGCYVKESDPTNLHAYHYYNINNNVGPAKYYWSGNCVNGFAEGPGELKIYVIHQNKPYLMAYRKGNFLKGALNGHGTSMEDYTRIYSQRAYIYEGNFNNGSMTGDGEIKYDDKCQANRNSHCVVSYKGGWSGGLYQGYGEAVLGNGETYKGSWDWGKRVNATPQEQRIISVQQKQKAAEDESKRRMFAALAQRTGNYEPMGGAFPSSSGGWNVRCLEGGTAYAFITSGLYCGGSSDIPMIGGVCNESIDSVLRSTCRGGQ